VNINDVNVKGVNVKGVNIKKCKYKYIYMESDRKCVDICSSTNVKSQCQSCTLQKDLRGNG
jgi:hypothetical protein